MIFYLGLRYDLTVPFAKFIALNKNKINMPFKRYEISKVFRDGPVKLGRDREFTQCDVDVVGINGQMIESELISLYVEAFSKLKIDIIIKYNSRNLMSGLISECGIEDDLISKTITIVDKIEKLSPEDFRKSLLEIGLTKKQAEILLQYFSLSLKELNIKFENTDNEKIKLGLTELNNLNEYIENLNLSKYCIFTSSLARGQDYYTGNVFEVYEKTGKLSCSIGGGGRYDKIITDFIDDGNTYPAVGVSFGLTSLYELMKNNKEFQSTSQVDFYIIPIGTEKESLKLANDIRLLGIKVDIDMSGRKLKKSLDYANKEQIPYVIVLGDDEVKNGYFEIKYMFENKSVRVQLEDLEKIKFIK